MATLTASSNPADAALLQWFAVLLQQGATHPGSDTSTWPPAMSKVTERLVNRGSPVFTALPALIFPTTT